MVSEMLCGKPFFLIHDIFFNFSLKKDQIRFLSTSFDLGILWTSGFQREKAKKHTVMKRRRLRRWGVPSISKKVINQQKSGVSWSSLSAKSNQSAKRFETHQKRDMYNSLKSKDTNSKPSPIFQKIVSPVIFRKNQTPSFFRNNKAKSQ